MHTFEKETPNTNETYIVVFKQHGRFDIAIEGGLSKAEAMRMVNYLNGGDGYGYIALK